MNDTQKLIAAYMLRQAEDELANHSSNDFEFWNTPETLEFVKEMIAASDFPDDLPSISADGKKIYVADFEVASYCARLLEEELAEIGKVPISIP